MSWGSATYLRFVDEANESGALNWGEVVGGSADVWEGGVPGGVVESATAVRQCWFRMKQEVIAPRLTHTLKVGHSDGRKPSPPTSPPHPFVL